MARLWLRMRPAPALVFAILSSACTTSYQLGSPAGADDARAAQASAAAPDVTGSISVPAALPPEHDLAFARAAASEVLGRSGKDSSAAWENPRTGARGTVTPIASAYTQEGRLCRDFLASYVHDGSESWMQGEACRAGRGGKWEVRRLNPWRRS
jgi:surface antigen